MPSPTPTGTRSGALTHPRARTDAARKLRRTGRSRPAPAPLSARALIDLAGKTCHEAGQPFAGRCIGEPSGVVEQTAGL
ncbi:hypothetical protein GCM10011326_03290 [Salipiger profundus]|nr:hypothetical protein GCM10011326_03290 [Salipiger profundus]